MIREREYAALPGLPVALGLLTLLVLAVLAIVTGARTQSPSLAVGGALTAALCIIGMKGLVVVNRNEAKVLQFFGRYAGTIRHAGLRWANPLYTKRSISQRIRNFESAHLKVNDNEGNPIEIAAVVVWRGGGSDRGR